MLRTSFSRFAAATTSILPFIVFIVFIVILGTSSVAHAQYYGPPRRYAAPGYYAPPPFYRSGLILGGAVGVGLISASDCGDTCGGGFSGEVHIGGMLNPRTALVFDAWTTIHPSANNDNATTNSIFTGALQIWLNDIVWLKGGIGVGRTSVTDQNDVTTGDASGLALMGAAGVELVHYVNFALDLQARAGHTFYSNSQGGDVEDFAFMIGFNWY